MQHPALHPRDQASVETRLRALLAETLGMPKSRIAAFEADTALFGALPEFDSMAVAHFLTGFEEKFVVTIEDDDVEAEDFATFGTLLAFTDRMMAK